MLERSQGIDPQRTGPLIGTLEVAFDQMHGLIQRVSQGKAIAYPRALIDRLLGGSAAEQAPVVEETAGPLSPLGRLIPNA